MKSYELWRRIINGMVYTKEVATLRVNTVFAMKQLSTEEYTDLMQLIDDKYVA